MPGQVFKITCTGGGKSSVKTFEIFHFQYDPAVIAKLQRRVTLCRTWIAKNIAPIVAR
jgi:hypothetical protein